MKLVEPRTLSGFMELEPSSQLLFEKYKNIIESTYQKYSFTPLDTPVIEYANVLLAKAGGETEKQIYRLKKGDNDLALRFDLTVPLAKYVAKNYNELVFPFKRYQIGKVYRGERAQRGRFREFYQCDIDVIGDETLPLIYDAQIPVIIGEILNKMEIGKYVIRLNNRKILNGFFSNLNLTDFQTEILRIIDKIDKIGAVEVENEIKELTKYSKEIMSFISITGSNDEILRQLEELKIEDEIFVEGLNELKEVVNYLKLMKFNDYKIDLTIARGLDYYTGTVYETTLINNPEIGSVASGGRYENLAGYYTNKKLPGVGISIGLTRLFYNLLDAGVIKDYKKPIVDYLIIPMDGVDEFTFNIYNQYLNENKKVEICMLDKNFKQKMKYANRLNVPYVIIIGENEKNNNEYVLKNMYDGSQKIIKL
ncbi:MAG: histidine--tRNA ligase [Tenericutes bacterium]|nr:histidine--tRNA ligase [Mycoplasmatota bacterium]